MTEQFDPKAIVRLNKLLTGAPDLDLLWFSAVDDPWLLTTAEAVEVASISPAETSNLVGWVADVLKREGVVGEYLLLVVGLGVTPWARVRLGDSYGWLQPLMGAASKLAFIPPDERLRLDVTVTGDLCRVTAKRRDVVEGDEDEEMEED